MTEEKYEPIHVWHGTFNAPNTIAIEQNHEGIYITTDTGLELAYLLMSLCKGQGTGEIHILPKDKTK